MTVEIAVMNKEAVALAADSAVTLTADEGRRMFPSGQKLFEISANHPVGVMIYNNLSFMGIPWESIVGMYRGLVGNRKFDTLGGYAEKMIEVLKSLADCIPESEQEAYVRHAVFHLLEKICGDIAEDAEKQEKKTNKTISAARRRRLVLNKVGDFLARLVNMPDVSDGADFHKMIDKRYGELVVEMAKEIFQRNKIPLSGSSIAARRLREIGTRFFSKDTESFFIDPAYSGLVIAGLGEQDLFPCLITFRVRGVLQGTLIYQRIKNLCCSINFETRAALRPFGQSDVIDTFRYGIRPEYRDELKGRLRNLSRESWLKHAPSVLKLLRGNEHKKDIERKLMEKTSHMVIDPWLDFENLLERDREHLNERLEGFISVLPRSDLAEMARTLVEFTCFYRKYTEFKWDEVTVAGPVHAALISKDEGFKWVK